MSKAYHKGKSRRKKEDIIRWGFFIVALASIITLSLIVVFLFMEGLPIFGKVSVKDFIFGHYWYPTDDQPEFGIFPLIVASLAVTGVASMISIPLGVLTALYLAEAASAKVRQWIKPIVELLAALPSVVIGFFGMVIVAPFLQEIFDILKDNPDVVDAKLWFLKQPTKGDSLIGTGLPINEKEENDDV